LNTDSEFVIHSLKFKGNTINDVLALLKCGASYYRMIIMSEKTKRIFLKYNLDRHSWTSVKFYHNKIECQYYALRSFSEFDDFMLSKDSIFCFKYFDLEDYTLCNDSPKYLKLKQPFNRLQIEEWNFDINNNHLEHSPFIIKMDKNFDKAIDCSIFTRSPEGGDMVLSEKLYNDLQQNDISGLHSLYSFYVVPSKEEQPLYTLSKTAIENLERHERKFNKFLKEIVQILDEAK
jgi:hypothetical protein